MDTRTRDRLIGGAMVAIGLFQAAYGYPNGDVVFAALGLAYALIGVAYLSESDAF